MQRLPGLVESRMAKDLGEKRRLGRGGGFVNDPVNRQGKRIEHPDAAPAGGPPAGGPPVGGPPVGGLPRAQGTAADSPSAN
ncbi:MAG: hypothetical protein QUU85_19360, partial [Candidatus Eisenbacteria bacterium]|nr:hypothetical protein [Candidatus Eisenbacteria bacterium]